MGKVCRDDDGWNEEMSQVATRDSYVTRPLRSLRTPKGFATLHL